MAGATPSEPLAVRLAILVGSALAVVALTLLLYAQPRVSGAPQASGLASLNAALNAAAAVCLVIGYGLIRRRRLAAHRRAMLTAFGFSCAFLVSYLLHHAQVGSVPFRGQGWLRTLYFALLVPHVILATLMLPLALFTIYRGWTARLEAHRRIARVTLPLWLYVSVSGVVLYWMLYRMG